MTQTDEDFYVIEWKYSTREGQGVKLDFSLPFSEAIADVRSQKGGKMRTDSHVYHVFAALFNGDVIDDYANPPANNDGKPIRNIASRVAELRHTWNISIGSRYKKDKPYVEYCIDKRGV